MITPNEYGDAIEALLMEKFPGEKVYRELVQENFDRPSNEVECEDFSGNVDASSDAIDTEVKMVVRTFVEVDAYHNSQFSALYRRAMAILGLFAGGYIEVSDPDTGEKRAPKVTAAGVPVTGKDFAEVRLTFRLQLARADFAPPETLPVMEDLEIVMASK